MLCACPSGSNEDHFILSLWEQNRPTATQVLTKLTPQCSNHATIHRTFKRQTRNYWQIFSTGVKTKSVDLWHFWASLDLWRRGANICQFLRNLGQLRAARFPQLLTPKQSWRLYVGDTHLLHKENTRYMKNFTNIMCVSAVVWGWYTKWKQLSHFVPAVKLACTIRA